MKTEIQTGVLMNTNWLNTPAYIGTSKINIKGSPARRLFVVYKTIGCEYDKNKNGCTMCNFAEYANPEIRGENLEAQHDQALGLLEEGKFEHFDLATLGNFYNDKEISPETRRRLLSRTAAIPTVKRVLTESRRGYLTVEKLKEAKSCLREDQILELAFGYESSNPKIRNGILNKGVPEEHLDESIQMCQEAGVDFVAYVLIKPHGLSEGEAIIDAVDTAIHVLEKAERCGVYARIAFEPVFVVRDKPIERLFLSGDYKPPKLWSVVEVLAQTTKRLGKSEGKLFVGLSDENLSGNRQTSNCGVCDKEVANTVQQFNSDQDASKLKSFYHECKDQWEKDVVSKL